MPTQTFFNLPIEKQNRILRAGKKEFTNSILPKAMVSNIVKEAEISRGSFYDYFADLEDLFLYLVKKIYSRGEKCFSRFYAETNNDYFNALKLHYKHVLEIFGTPENRQFNLNAFASLALLNVDKKTISNIFPVFGLDDSYIESGNFEISGYKTEFIELLEMIKWVNIYRYLSSEISNNEALEIYSRYVDMLSSFITKK